MNKVVYNSCYGGFILSSDAVEWLKEKGLKTDEWSDSIPRHHPLLVKCVETLGAIASGMNSELKIAEIYGNTYRIEEYDGFESVVEPEDINWIVI